MVGLDEYKIVYILFLSQLTLDVNVLRNILEMKTNRILSNS